MTQLLTIAGGVMSVYILLALITSHVCEWVSAFTNQRGHLLERAIVALVGGVQRDPTRAAASKALVDHLYEHPLMGNLGATKARLPSYIPARTFSISLVAALRDYTAALASSAAAETAAKALPPFSTPDVLLDDLKARIVALPDDSLKTTLVTVLQGTKNDYDAALAAIDGWFDAQMDRVSGAYKRWSGIVQAIIALIVVAALNSDTLNLITQLHGVANAPVLMDAAEVRERPGLDRRRPRLERPVHGTAPDGPLRCGRHRRMVDVAAERRRMAHEDRGARDHLARSADGRAVLVRSAQASGARPHGGHEARRDLRRSEHATNRRSTSAAAGS